MQKAVTCHIPRSSPLLLLTIVVLKEEANSLKNIEGNNILKNKDAFTPFRSKYCWYKIVGRRSS